jgi:hypothetical protein
MITDNFHCVNCKYLNADDYKCEKTNESLDFYDWYLRSEKCIDENLIEDTE